MTFLFDIGRVLLDFDYENSISRLLPAGITDASSQLERLLEKKDEFETGSIPKTDYISWALEVLGSTATPDEFEHAWRHIFTPNKPMWDCVRKLAASGHHLILFSNINSIHWPWLVENFPEFSLFHAAVVSFETGFIKPQSEIYQYAIATHRLDPAATLYIDDLPQNIATGRDLGFRCWQYDLKDHPAFEDWLAANLKSEI